MLRFSDFQLNFVWKKPTEKRSCEFTLLLGGESSWPTETAALLGEGVRDLKLSRPFALPGRFAPDPPSRRVNIKAQHQKAQASGSAV